jgi:tetratricopeptide (TPR) repeat protein
LHLIKEYHKNALQIKEEGNSYFKAGDYEAALVSYTKALKLYPSDDKDKERLQNKATVYKNRAACYLKLVSILYVEIIHQA